MKFDWEFAIRFLELEAFRRTIDVYTANQTVLAISDPDLWVDPNQHIVYDLSQPNPHIEASCKAYGGMPEPDIHW